jgi:type I restriction enzyme S subunit
MTRAKPKSEWRTVKLGSCVELVSGYPFKSKQFTDDAQDIPLVKGENLHQGYIDWQKAKRWKASEFANYERFQLKEGDVVLAMDRPWIDAGLKFSWIRKTDPRALLVQRVARMRGADGLLTRYLRYIIGSLQFTDYIKPIVTGVSVPHISGQQIKDFEFRLPPVSIQNRIVAIISSYDDLLENNMRRIQILEEMARRIYEEWFVRFRFPGHESVKFVESELGSIPEGWGVKTLDKVATINGLSIKRGQEPSNMTYVDIASVSTGKIDSVQTLSFDEAPGRARRIVKHGDIIWSNVRPNRKSYALIMNPPRDMIVSTGFTVVSATSLPYGFLYQALTTDRFATYLSNRAKGAAYPAVGSEDFASAKVIIPSATLLSRFGETSEAMQLKKNVLLKKNESLRTIRDLLLPKLTSGEIDVSHFPEPED